MSETREERWSRLERELTRLVNLVERKLDQRNTELLRDFINNREYATALDWLYAVLTERLINISPEEMAIMARLAEDMGIKLRNRSGRNG